MFLKIEAIILKKAFINVNFIKSAVMQIDKALTNDRLPVSKVSFYIPTMYKQSFFA